MGKDWWKSLTIWGWIINAVVGLLVMTGAVNIDLTAEQQQELAQKIVNFTTAMAEIIAWVMIFIGRLRAKQPITNNVIPRIGGK